MTKKRQRRRRDERIENPAPIRIMERDKNIMRTVYEYRVMTTQQIQRLFFPSLHRAYNRLEALYDHAYLDRRFMGVYTDINNMPIMYVLDRRGAELLRVELGLEINWNSGHKDVGQQFLLHTLAINEVRIAVTKGCQQSENFTLLQWLSESDLKSSFDYVSIPGMKDPVSVIPDSYFKLEIPEGYAHFFLELDRGTMYLKRFKQKIAAYRQYYRTGAYQERYGTKSLRVLTVTLSQPRADSLKRVTEKAGGKKRYWFAVLANISEATVLTAPIWQLASTSEIRPLIE